MINAVMPTHVAAAATAETNFRSYCTLLSSLAHLPQSDAALIADAMRKELNLTPAQYCEATALVFGGKVVHAAAEAQIRKAVRARPSGRKTAPKPGRDIWLPASGEDATAADPLLLQRISVYWPEYGAWYEGVVVDVNAAGEHLTLYGIGTANEEEYRCNLNTWTDGLLVLGPAGPQLIAKLAAYGWGPEAAPLRPAPAAVPAARPATAAPRQLLAMSWEQLEAKLKVARSVNVMNAVGDEVARRKAAIHARLAELGESDDEMA